MKNRLKTSMGDEDISSTRPVGEVNGWMRTRLMVVDHIAEPEEPGN